MFIIISTILGGGGLLLYGIEIMKDSLEWISQHKGQHLLELAGKSIFKSILAGFAVTVINQKSSATTVMVVGMVNAGIYSLVQAAGVIMGANIGTTVTAQLLAFRLELIAPCILGIAAIVWRYSRTKKIQNLGKIFLGFSIMFIGMYFMEQGMALLREYPEVTDFIKDFTDPSLGQYLLLVLAGFLFTALVRSSSLVTGIMIALSAQGILTLSMATPLILGLNMGKCVTTLQVSRGTSRTAKQAALIHFLFNFFGTVLVVIFFRGLYCEAMEWLAPGDLPRQIANAHTLFNLGTTIICLPFIRVFVKASERIIPPLKGEVEERTNLDVRMLETPGLALAQAYSEITRLLKMAFGSYQLAFESLEHGEERILIRIKDREEHLLKLQKEIEVYLVKLAQKNINSQQHKMLSLMLSVTGDIEQISDISNNIVLLSQYKKENEVVFSQEAEQDLLQLHEQICLTAQDLIKAMEESDGKLAETILSAEDRIKAMETDLRQAHVERLSHGVCSPGSGVLFVDYVSNLERVAEHIKKTGYFVMEVSRN